jgi:MerR family transcriptional regulator, redox-sensitive transcriptional activator SoxR
MAADLSIGEVARRTGLRTSALRYYEDAGILPKPTRVSGQRRYDADIVRRVDLLRFAQQAGFTLDEIKSLFHGCGSETPLSARWRSLARKKLVELDELAARVTRMHRALELSLECGCMRVEDCSLSPADIPNTAERRAKTRSKCAC